MMSHAAQKDMVTAVDCRHFATVLVARSLSWLILQCDSAARIAANIKRMLVPNVAFSAILRIVIVVSSRGRKKNRFSSQNMVLINGVQSVIPPQKNGQFPARSSLFLNFLSPEFQILLSATLCQIIQHVSAPASLGPRKTEHR